MEPRNEMDNRIPDFLTKIEILSAGTPRVFELLRRLLQMQLNTSILLCNDLTSLLYLSLTASISSILS